MANKTFATAAKIENARYPRLAVSWQEDSDQHGYKGDAVIWSDGDTRVCQHEIHIRQSAPLGSIFVDLDCVTYGTWATAVFDGTRLDERDLQWATQWAIQAIKHKHLVVGNETCKQHASNRVAESAPLSSD